MKEKDFEEELEKEQETEKTDYGLIRPRSIDNEMTESYLDYAMSVIVARALPDARDGLKPVQRRILYTMRQMGLSSTSKHQKSAKIIGQILGLFHPHGESAVYDAMVRLAQNWSMRERLVDGQGNFGSMDGDPAAAMRYTEARLTYQSDLLLKDIDKDTVNWRDNYDGTVQEPVVLPSQWPNLIINGSQGIAVGMACNIPPHNLIEICRALIAMIDKKDIDPDEIVEYIQGPDFPTGGIIYDRRKIKEALLSGKGGILIRGVAEIVEEKHKEKIIISQLPYQVNKANFISHIAELVKLKKIEGISDIRDESDRQEGVRIVIDLKSHAPSNKILNQLYNLTELQGVIHYNMVALIDGIQPRLMNIVELMEEFLKHRRSVIYHRTAFELKNARERAHILEGLKIALDHLDAIIKLIRGSKDRDEAKKGLIESYKLSEIQANAILDMRLSQLANLERQRIYDEYEAILKLIADLEDILAKSERIEAIIKGELTEIIEKNKNNSRLTQVNAGSLEGFSADDLIPNEPTIITVTVGNYVKRSSPDSYRAQLRGGKGVSGITTREEDSVLQIIWAQTHDDIYFFSELGKVYKVKAYDIPVSSRQSKGVALPNIVSIGANEKVTSVLNLSTQHKSSYLFFATKKGSVKRVELDAFKNIRKTGVNAIKLRSDDQLLWVRQTSGEQWVAQITKSGQVILYKEDEIRAMGRSASGVRGVRLKKGDEVIQTLVINPNDKYIAVLSERGIGKKVAIEAFRNQHRGGSGIRIAKLNTKTGLLADAVVLSDSSKDLIIATQSGVVLRLAVESIKSLSRQASGVILIRMAENDAVSSMSVINKDSNE